MQVFSSDRPERFQWYTIFIGMFDITDTTLIVQDGTCSTPNAESAAIPDVHTCRSDIDKPIAWCGPNALHTRRRMKGKRHFENCVQPLMSVAGG
jgi:hypothetical protein